MLRVPEQTQNRKSQPQRRTTTLNDRAASKGETVLSAVEESGWVPLERTAHSPRQVELSENSRRLQADTVVQDVHIVSGSVFVYELFADITRRCEDIGIFFDNAKFFNEILILSKLKEYLGIILVFPCSIFIFSTRTCCFSIEQRQKLVCRTQ